MHGGNLDQIVGRIQQKTGEAIEEFLNKLTSRGTSAVSEDAASAAPYADSVSREIHDKYQDVAEHVGDGYEQILRVVTRNPTQSVAAAFGVGLALGVVVWLALRSR